MQRPNTEHTYTWPVDGAGPWEPPEADPVETAKAVARHLRKHLHGPNITIRRRASTIRLRWTDGPPHLPGEVLALFDSLCQWGVGWSWGRLCSAHIVAAAMAHHYDVLVADGLEPSVRLLLKRTWPDLGRRSVVTRTPYGSRRHAQAEILCGLAQVHPDTGLGYYARGDVDLAHVLVQSGTGVLDALRS